MFPSGTKITEVDAPTFAQHLYQCATQPYLDRGPWWWDQVFECFTDLTAQDCKVIQHFCQETGAMHYLVLWGEGDPDLDLDLVHLRWAEAPPPAALASVPPSSVLES